jgi:hypothetical protein
MPAKAKRSNLSIPTMSNKPALKVPQLQRSGQHTPEEVQAITLKIKSLLRASEFCKSNTDALQKIS